MENQTKINGIVNKEILRVRPETIKDFKNIYPAFVLDYLGKHGFLIEDVKPIQNGMRICGPAVTCLGPDLYIRKMAMDIAVPGDILVIAANGSKDYACFGDGAAKKMKNKGLGGVVVYGATRDASRIRELDFPVFSKGITPRNYYYPFGCSNGAVNVEVACGSAVVKPGDLIIGDDDGVIVVPRLIAEKESKRIKKSLYKKENEREKNLETPYNVEEFLIRTGVEIR